MVSNNNSFNQEISWIHLIQHNYKAKFNALYKLCYFQIYNTDPFHFVVKGIPEEKRKLQKMKNKMAESKLNVTHLIFSHQTMQKKNG